MTYKKANNMLQIYSLKDLTTQTHGQPMFYQNDEHAKKEIKQFFLLANPSQKLSPKNYDIYHHGEFNEETGYIKTLFKHELIINCNAIIEEEINTTLDKCIEHHTTLKNLTEEIKTLTEKKDLLVSNQLEKEIN